MKILLICTSYNALTQRVHTFLQDLKHEVSLEFSISSNHMIEAVNLFNPELILAPYLKEKIPKEIYENILCLIIHPGIIGDRGPSSLDWAILNKEKTWGVTLLQASEHMDAGDIWASGEFILRAASKASIYRNEVSDASIKCLEELFLKLKDKNFKAQVLDTKRKEVKGKLRVSMKQESRKIDFLKDSSEDILRKIYASDSNPGVLCTLFDKNYYLYDAFIDESIEFKQKEQKAGDILAKRNSAICICTKNSSIWISQLKEQKENSFKLPSVTVLKDKLKGIKESRIALINEQNLKTFKEITYKQIDEVGYLSFDFYNGAMSIEQCVRLKYAYELVLQKDIKVLVLEGGYDFFSNGIHLNIMQDSLKKEEDAWSNIHAMNDIVKSIINTSDIITISALSSNAGAGGAILALACDYVLAREGIIINAHYKTLGLEGSEYHTYLLPSKVGQQNANQLLENCLPLSSKKALKINFVNKVFSNNRETYKEDLELFAKNLSQSDDFYDFLDEKQKNREKDEEYKSLETYRKEELVHMYKSFYEKDSAFNTLREDFVLKKKTDKTPLRLANHRRL